MWAVDGRRDGSAMVLFVHRDTVEIKTKNKAILQVSKHINIA